MILTVHTQLCGGSSRKDNHVLIGSGLDKSRRLDEGMNRSGTESPGVGPGSVDQTCDFRLGFGKVASAPLVHIAAGLFAAVDYVIYLFPCNAAVVNQMKKSQYTCGFINQIFQYNMGSQGGVYIVSSLYITHQFSIVIEGLCMLFLYEFNDFVVIYTLF